jgi:hypothetical protein
MSAGAAEMEMVRVRDISRFLRIGETEIRDMLAVDGLPYVNLPGKTKPGVRVALRDLHRFLLKRWTPDTALKDYAVFREAFWAASN